MKGLKGFSQVKRSGEKKSVFGSLQMFNFSDYAGEKLVFRLIGPIRGYAMHWIEIKTKSGKNVKVPKMCLNYDADTDSFNDNGCPYCNLDPKSGRKYLVNAIWRAEQDREPKKVTRTKNEKKISTMFEDFECHIKEPSSKSWTPVVVLNLPVGVVSELNELGKNNIDKKGNAHDVNDEKYGVDISIRYSPEKAGEAKYRIDSLKRTPLTDEEMEYLLHNIEDIPTETEKEAKEEYKKLKKVAVSDEEDDEDIEGLSYKEKDKKKSKYDEDDEDEEDLEDDDEDERPSKKSKSSKKRSRDEDDDYEDDDGEDEEDEDSEDDEDEDDEDERPSKKSKASKKRSRDDDDDDDDDFEDDDDDDDDFEDEDERPSKKSKASKKRSRDEDDDDDDEEEDERPSKRKKSRDYDDDDDDDFDDLD